MDYWERRAIAYNELEWVQSKKLMDAIILVGGFERSDVVLDVGTGTGLVAKEVAPLVQAVIALDISPHMLSLSPDGQHNVSWVVGDARNLEFADSTFDKVIARHVFHHIVAGTRRAMQECHRVLKHNGLMIFNEGVPPSERTKQDYIGIFKLKEKRLTFMPEDMAELMASAGFNIVRRQTVVLHNMSVHKWLKSGNISKRTQDAIFLMHRNAPRYFWDDYQMIEKDGDCFINMKMVTLVGQK